MKVWEILFLMCVLCAPAAYGQGFLGRFARVGKASRTTTAVERSVATQARQQAAHVSTPRVSTAVTSRVSTAATASGAHLATRGISFVVKTPTSAAVRQGALEAPALGGNTLSRKMQKEAAQQMRPYLFNSTWSLEPVQEAAYNNVEAGIATRGNLTEMSAEQFAQAADVYRQAMGKVLAISQHADAEIYYLGTSESQPIAPEQIRRTLAEIVEAQGAVSQAQVVWGAQYPALQEAELYLKNLHSFYMTLGTGMYFSPEKSVGRTWEREDGHLYCDREFGLWAKGTAKTIPQRSWKHPSTWFANPRGSLPEQQRVAVLQDSEEVLNGLQIMKEQAGLAGWQFDVYEDPEEFLNRVPWQQYDLILTDVLIKNGGGRYLARQLRSQGYNGTILTLSGFDELHDGKQFFDDGIDGMITVGVHPMDYPGHFWASLNNYFELKKEEGWEH